MKKKFVFFGIILVFIICMVWYFVPKTFLNGISVDDIVSVSVFNGSTGQQMILEDADDISAIVNNIQSLKMKRGKISINYDGYSFSLAFKDKYGNVMDSFIVNSKNVIRDDPFFYVCENGELCINFLQELENRYCGEE